MQFKSTIQLLALAAAVSAATTSDEVNSSSWTTLKPSATYKSATTDYSSTFGIAIEPITTGSLAPTTSSTAVSYTHLDVYKRQVLMFSRSVPHPNIPQGK